MLLYSTDIKIHLLFTSINYLVIIYVYKYGIITIDKKSIYISINIIIVKTYLEMQ